MTPLDAPEILLTHPAIDAVQARSLGQELLLEVNHRALVGLLAFSGMVLLVDRLGSLFF